VRAEVEFDYQFTVLGKSDGKRIFRGKDSDTGLTLFEMEMQVGHLDGIVQNMFFPLQK